MNKKIKISIFIIFFFFFGLLLFDTASAQQVRINNFNVVQRNIPSTSSNVDFRLTISQQDQSLDCSNLPFTNGSLQWKIWYETSLTGPKTTVRAGSSGLPLSPNPLNLDFSISSFVPNSGMIQAGGANFFAAIGCAVNIGSLAISAPIRVSVGTGGGTGGGPGGTGGQPGQPTEVSFNIPNPIQAESLVDLAKAIGRFLFQIAIPIAVIVIIYAGILFLTSGGDKAKITTARNTLWYAVIGLAIILIGQGFFTLIKSILNLGG